MSYHLAAFKTRVARYYNPGGEIGKKADAGAQRNTKPDNPHQNNIDPEVTRHACAHPGNLFVAFVQHQGPWRRSQDKGGDSIAAL